ncbi:enoyl-CoA hydratase/isomerase family protein [Streptomyces sp. NPDC048479]|uniref:enoyl-CoA hydratase-related protein n=1 Tax=Streptomyces sp. NPDC048479 TaxID=3154725 RepID=UPI00341C7E30
MTGAPDELVLAEHRGPGPVLTFNRPAKLNAWTDELESYFTLLDAAEDDPDVRAVVVTGAGRGFCAGADLQRLQAAGEVSPIP